MKITVYSPERVESSRTHERIIDINVYGMVDVNVHGIGHVRICLFEELAIELIHKMLTALSTPFKEEEATTVK